MKRNSVAQKTRKRTTIKNTERKATLRKEPHISSFQASEGIIKVILDKIISISIHQSDMNQINKQLNDYCFDYIQAQMEPLLEENFMNYTKLKSDNNTFFWKNKKQPENQWIEIFEPESVETDRFESSTVKVQEIPKKKETINEINEGIEHNENGENNENNNNNTKKTRMNKEKTMRINIIRPNDKKEETIINNENNKENNNNIDHKTRNTQNQRPLNLNQNNRGGKKKIPIIDFPSEEIPGIDNEFRHEKYDPPNIHILRKDIEEEIKNKEKESKLNSNKIKSVKLKEDLEKLTKNIRPLDTNKFTFDSNGKIISFKQYKLDSLSKDFTFIRNTIREKEEKEDPKLKSRKLSVKDQNNSNVVVIKDNSRINEFNSPEEKKDKAPREKIIPSGSNFKLILPNIGVVVKENNNQKEGGKDFNKYFKKYSINDYDKILNEYVPLQNKSKIKNRFERMNLTSTLIQKQLSESIAKSNNNTINNTQINISTINNKRSENTNPLLTSNDNIQINETNTSYINQNSSYMKTAGNSLTKNSVLYNPIMTSVNMRSAFINFSQDKRGNNFADSIIMKKLGSSSLKMEIDSLQDLKTKPNYRKINSIKKENLFDKNFIRNNKLRLNNKTKENPFLAFNKKILTDANFGNAIDQKNAGEKENIVISRHLNMQEAFRELGNSMISGLKIKFPRNRKVELSK